MLNFISKRHDCGKNVLQEMQQYMGNIYFYLSIDLLLSLMQYIEPSTIKLCTVKLYGIIIKKRNFLLYYDISLVFSGIFMTSH